MEFTGTPLRANRRGNFMQNGFLGFANPFIPSFSSNFVKVKNNAKFFRVL